MPPRKRAASAPKADPEQEPQETPAEDANEEPTAEEAPEPAKAAKSREPDKAPADAGWEASPAAPDSKPSLCRIHFADGVSDGVTAVACEHGSWVRT
jgi:hypothetical protein